MMGRHSILVRCSFRCCSTSSGNRRSVLVSSPDPLSNLVAIKWPEPRNAQERKLVALYEQVQSFNHTFWAQHNNEFKQRKNEFVSSLNSDHKVTTSQLAVFYRQYLNDKQHNHKQYLRKWAWLNWKLTYTLLLTRLKNIIYR